MTNPWRILAAVLPLVALVGLVAVFALNINRDPSLIQSALIDKPVPQFTLPELAGSGVPGFATADLTGEVHVVNVFASWCIPCRDEHPYLLALKEQTSAKLMGINQKDAAENAVAFLKELGNPYDGIGGDGNGRVSIDWGVYGVPETFVVNPKGTIVFKHTGPIDARSLPEVVAAVARAKAG